MTNNLFNSPEILKARQKSEKLKKQELADITKTWGKAGHDIENWFSYDVNFQTTLGMTLSQWVEKRRTKTNHPTWALDLLAPGEQNRHLALDGGLSVTLADVRTPEQKNADASRNLDVIENNLFSPEFFDDIKNWMKKHNIKGFDLVMARPMGGLEDIPQIPDFYRFILKNILDLTSNQNGLVILQLPWEVAAYLPNVQEKLGDQVEVKYTIPQKDEEHPQRVSPTLMITKTGSGVLVMKTPQVV